MAEWYIECKVLHLHDFLKIVDSPINFTYQERIIWSDCRKMDLENLSLAELTELQTQVARAIFTVRERNRREALAELEERAATLGFSLSELVGVAVPPRRRKPVRNTYVNPENADETWSGRGRRPTWLEAALQKGHTLDDLKV